MKSLLTSIASFLRRKRLYLHAFLQETYFWVLNRNSQSMLTGNTDYVISLTSFPARIDKVYITIESIFNQRVKPGIVHLWLSSSEITPDQLPKSIKRLKKRGLRVSFVEKNVRSYNKLVHSLEEYPESVIVTIDDDIIYPSYWFKKMYEIHLEYPKEILCYRGHNILLNEYGQLCSYNEMMDGDNSSDEASYTLIPTGVSGVMYPPFSLDKIVTNEGEYMNLSPMADDIWFKCCSLLNKTKCKRVFRKNIHFLMINSTQSVTLSKKNVGECLNDKQLDNVFKKYNLADFVTH